MNVIAINDLTKKHVEPYVGLNEKQLKRFYEPNEGIFICESKKVIQRAIAAGYEAESFFVQEDRIEDISDLIEGAIPVYTASQSVMDSITGYALTGGVLAAMRRRSLPAPKDIISGLSKVVILDDIENPTNVGAIFRSAAGLGAQAILLTPGCADPLYRRAARVSMGTVFQIDWAYTDASFIRQMKDEGFTLMAFSLSDDAVKLQEAKDQSKKSALVLGNEDHGISTEILSLCDRNVIIPMHNGVDSLNVAAASAVAFWEIFSI